MVKYHTKRPHEGVSYLEKVVREKARILRRRPLALADEYRKRFKKALDKIKEIETTNEPEKLGRLFVEFIIETLPLYAANRAAEIVGGPVDWAHEVLKNRVGPNYHEYLIHTEFDVLTHLIPKPKTRKGEQLIKEIYFTWPKTLQTAYHIIKVAESINQRQWELGKQVKERVIPKILEHYKDHLSEEEKRSVLFIARKIAKLLNIEHPLFQ